jgi:multidrug efflux pump subunit AcrB
LPAESTAPLLTAREPLADTLGLAIEAENAPNSISERITIELKSRLAVLPGTKEIEIYGEPQQKILVAVDADALLFLMGARSALIVGAALSLTRCMVLAGLKVMDIPLHQMSVKGLIIVPGLLIDNAIVVVEEYKINRRRGDSLSAAISHSVRHLFLPLLAFTANRVPAHFFRPLTVTNFRRRSPCQPMPL